MKVAAAVLTRNQHEHSREDLFAQTVASLASVDELFVIDNGSTDGTQTLVAGGPWRSYCSTGPNTTSGFGTWMCCRILAATDADICIVSDDDMVWRDGFRLPLEAWWELASCVLTGGHLEPEFPWNHITGTQTHNASMGSVRGLMRTSTGAASWTFRRDRYRMLAEAVRTIPIDRQGTWDVPVCQSITARGWTIGQLDLAEHVGSGQSSWGNGTEAMYGWDVRSVRDRLCASS